MILAQRSMEFCLHCWPVSSVANVLGAFIKALTKSAWFAVLFSSSHEEVGSRASPVATLEFDPSRNGV